MDHPIRDQILSGVFLTCIVAVVLCIVGLMLFASQKKRTNCAWGSVLCLLVLFGLFVYSPSLDRAAKQLATVQSLNTGYYEIEDVWRVNGRDCAILLPERLNGESMTNGACLTSPTSRQSILCDITDTKIVGRSSKLKNYPFTGRVVVTETNGVRTIHMSK